jgi:hypothetical protein
VMLTRLLYRDGTLWADRPPLMDHAPKLDEYDRVFDYVGGRLAVVRSRPGKAAVLRPR